MNIVNNLPRHGSLEIWHSRWFLSHLGRQLRIEKQVAKNYVVNAKTSSRALTHTRNCQPVFKWLIDKDLILCLLVNLHLFLKPTYLIKQACPLKQALYPFQVPLSTEILKIFETKPFHPMESCLLSKTIMQFETSNVLVFQLKESIDIGRFFNFVVTKNFTD